MANVQQSGVAQAGGQAREQARESVQAGATGLAAVAVAGIVLAAVGVVVMATATVLTAIMARTIVTPPRRRADDTRVLDVDQDIGSVSLQATPDSVLPGEYSLFFDANAGHARLGDVLGVAPGSVTRTLLGVYHGNLATARTGRLSGWLYRTPADLGLSYENVLIPTSAGDAPAWLVPAASGTGASGSCWVIQVHGRGVTREEGLRAVPVFREADFTSLLISYRNDGEAPKSGDGRYGLGDTEWLDVESAIEFALRLGASEVVLMGWSMGGAIVLQTATRTRHRDRIRGLVLDSPVIDWADVVAHQSTLNRLPVAIARGAMHVMGRKWGGLFTGQAAPIDFMRLDFVARADELLLPILLLHSDDDGFVPVTGSRKLALRRPDIVTFVPFTVARHTKLFNYDPDGWTGAIRDWLATPHPLPAAVVTPGSAVPSATDGSMSPGTGGDVQQA
ncbi:alpha/beta fold hydrolase [Cryobacterium melibiosiphilum]|uniref:Alpha/beta fold hydrolase n=1 Tax=Cryobacterium melibiosiphilum TaxID=995039 RepID=A0A3A5MG67_9MICO|nr:alpha/beta hydrolase [Cryobacterium melibiosiphilum]RJT89160.1 alpha/beta fold hydrolase [Cryobacterium melibiosiphilum]